MVNHVKNILLVTPGFARDEKDTTCIPALQEFVLGLNTYYPEIKVTIVCLHYPEIEKTYHWFGNEVWALGAGNVHFPNRLRFWRKMKRTIRRLHNQKTFDLIHSFWFDEVTYLTSRVASKLNIPIFCTFMGQDAIGKTLYSRRISLPEENLIAISKFQQRKITDNLGLTVPNLISWGVSIPIKTEAFSVEKDVDIVNVGSFNEIKNQQEAIKIIAEVRKEIPSIKCIFVGTGPKLENVQSLVKKLGLEKHVFFQGQVSRAKTIKIIARSKLLLHSSDYESYGMIFAEAMVAKTMIVSKEVGIAKNYDFWGIYKTQSEAVSLITSLLTSPVYPSDSESLAHSIKPTIEAYVSFWRIKKDRT